MNVLSKHFCCFCLLVFVFFSPQLCAQSATPEWIRTANSQVSGGDRGEALVRDASGNLIVYGTLNHINPYSKPTLLLQKFAPNQSLLWETSFRSTLPYLQGFYPERAVDVEVDNNGNIYTLSNAMISNNTAPDILLRKYDPNGNLLWSQDYDHSGRIEEGTELHVSGDGTATVLGRSQDPNDLQIVVLRYNTNGNLVFQYRRTDPGVPQEARDMEVTPDGGVIFAGTDNSYNRTFSLTRLDSAGALIWDQAGGVTTSFDVSRIALDSADNIYTLCKSITFVGDIISLDKFSPNGSLINTYVVPQTTAFMAHPHGLVVDLQSQVYFNFSYQDANLGTLNKMVKLDQNLSLSWDIGLDSTLNLESYQSKSLKMAPNGNLVVLGGTAVSQPTDANLLYLEYTPVGAKVRDLVWAGPGNGYDTPLDFQLDANGIAWATGTASSAKRNQDLLALRLDPSGGNQWHHLRDNSINGRDENTALATSPDGSVWLGGRSEGTYTLTGMFLNQYDASGTLTWDTLILPPDQHLYLGKLATDASNNVYALANSSDYLYLYKFSPQGNVLWMDDIPKGNADFFSEGTASLVIAPDGTIYLANNLVKNFSQTAWFVASYTPSGIQNWTWESPLPAGQNHARVTSIYPYNGGIAVGGQLYDFPAMRVLDSGGNLVNSVDHPQLAGWRVRFGLDQSGNAIFATDLSINGTSTPSLFKYDQGGNLLFQENLNNTGRDNIDAYDLAVDANGAIYLGGRCNTPAFGFASYTAKFNANGQFLWDDLSSISSNAQDVGIETVLPAPGGSVFMAGRYAQSPHQAQTARYDPAGVQTWDYRFPNGNYLDSEGLLLANGPGGELYMAGHTVGDTLAGDLLLVKFSQITDLESPLEDPGFTVYPNPARDWLRVERSHTDVPASLEILDVQGRVLYRLTAEVGQASISLPTASLSQGLYLLRLQEAGTEAEVRKFQVQ